MSLINDALKRARQSQPQHPQAPAPAPPVTLPPVETAPPAGPGAFVLVLIMLLILAAFSFIALAVIPRKQTAQKIPAAAPGKFAQVIAPAPVSSNPPAAVPATTQTVAAVAPPPPAAPALRLQGILINSDRPQAIVNGQSVFVGDTVNGFLVKGISRNHVSFIAPDGSEKTLTLGQ